MSNVYILPRRSNNIANSGRHSSQPVVQQQPKIVVVGGGVAARTLPALPGHKPGSRFVRAPAQLGNNGSRLLSQPYPPNRLVRVILFSLKFGVKAFEIGNGQK